MILAIDTSTRKAGVALWKDGSVVSALCWQSRHNHTAELMPAIQQVLSRAGVATNQLDCTGVALGPGGFSALRVGISAAKGLAMPLNIPLVGVGTLELEAYPYSDTGLPIRPLLDMGRSEVATSLFQNSQDSWIKLEEERICTPEELAASVSHQTLFCGEGVPARSAQLRQELGALGLIMSSHTQASRLWALASLTAERHKAGEVDSPAALQPFYLRSPSIGPPKSPQRVSQ